MTTEELEKWARQWVVGQQGRWVYPAGTPSYELRKAMANTAKEKIEELGYSITTDDFGNVVIQLPFKI